MVAYGISIVMVDSVFPDVLLRLLMEYLLLWSTVCSLMYCYGGLWNIYCYGRQCVP